MGQLRLNYAADVRGSAFEWLGPYGEGATLMSATQPHAPPALLSLQRRERANRDRWQGAGKEEAGRLCPGPQKPEDGMARARLHVVLRVHLIGQWHEPINWQERVRGGVTVVAVGVSLSQGLRWV